MPFFVRPVVDAYTFAGKPNFMCITQQHPYDCIGADTNAYLFTNVNPPEIYSGIGKCRDSHVFSYTPIIHVYRCMIHVYRCMGCFPQFQAINCYTYNYLGDLGYKICLPPHSSYLVTAI